MPQRKKKTVSVPKAAASAEQLEKALAKQKKVELVKVIVEIARANGALMRRLASRFGVEALPKERVTATRQAIADATDFDERDINTNFSDDYEADRAVKSDFSRLIASGQLREVLELSLELMSRGSYQVEMSDEGLMTDDLEECLQVVISALKKCDLPAAEVISWCTEMAGKDRVGFICNKELQALCLQFEPS